MFEKLFHTWKAVGIHIILALVLSFGLCYYFFQIHLPNVTLHDEVIEVPDLTNIDFEQAKEMLNQKTLTVEIKDTVYSTKHKPGSVVTQNPKPGEMVKENRRIYITLNSGKTPEILVTEELFKMIVKNDVNDVIEQVKSLGFEYKIDTINYKWKNYVSETHYNQKAIEIGVKIKKGSVLTLKVGNGINTDTLSTDSSFIIN